MSFPFLLYLRGEGDQTIYALFASDITLNAGVKQPRRF